MSLEADPAPPIGADALRAWRDQGWLVLGDALPPAIRRDLAGWVETVATPAGEGEHRLHYHEAGPSGPLLCRTERFIEDHAGLAALLTGGPLARLAGALMGERAALYKEKVNYKWPGGAGFAAHQYATAYAFADRHVTCVVAVDAMDEANGCLEFAAYGGRDLLPQDDAGCLDPAFADGLAWTPVDLPAGGVAFFTSHVPHRSGPNRSDRPRRALYLTYSPEALGDLRAAYYADRDRVLAEAGAGERARISTIGHFQGRTVAAERRP